MTPGEEAAPSVSSSSSSIKWRKAVAICWRLRLRPLEGSADRDSALLEVASEGSSPGLFSPTNRTDLSEEELMIYARK
ncbi:UNVERIFIED_CONTAM: hypothetical protein Sradi_7014500 [Sesamum radiatum]|uniref:Uncharacterized protein n=1 Tax=Sesamum radiatum TaxID=300843 RepID=A0AAW2JB70_SESRA